MAFLTVEEEIGGSECSAEKDELGRPHLHFAAPDRKRRVSQSLRTSAKDSSSWTARNLMHLSSASGVSWKWIWCGFSKADIEELEGGILGGLDSRYSLPPGRTRQREHAFDARRKDGTGQGRWLSLSLLLLGERGAHLRHILQFRNGKFFAGARSGVSFPQSMLLDRSQDRVADGIERQFNAGGDAQLVEDAK